MEHRFILVIRDVVAATGAGPTQHYAWKVVGTFLTAAAARQAAKQLGLEKENFRVMDREWVPTP